MPIVYTPVRGSSAIELIGYDTVTGEMRIRFFGKNSYPEYIWGGVEPVLVENFFLSGSKGSYYHTYFCSCHAKGHENYTVRKAMGSYRLSAIIRGIPKGPARALRTAKKGLESIADTLLPL